MKRSAWMFLGVVYLASLANAGSISYTCNSNVATIDGSGVCTYLDTTVANFYNSTFSNANANIFVTTSATGLGGSLQVTQFVAYSTYLNALAAESNDTTALNSLPSTEPSTFNGTNVGLTAALTNALGISGSQTTYGAVYGVYENPNNNGDPNNGTVCQLPGTNCFNGVISVVTPSGLSTETSGSQGLWFRDVAGTAQGAQPSNDYDYFSVIEHETDELLGTASCSTVVAGPTATNGCASNGPSAVDLFRYSGPGTRVFNAVTCAYFSPDGGATDIDGNNYNSTCGSHSAVADDDYADFSTNCKFVQDATGCLGHSLDITTDYQGGPGPEIQILNAVGYDVLAPEPGTLALFGVGFVALVTRRRIIRA